MSEKMNNVIEKTMKNLERNGFRPLYAKDSQQAVILAKDLIPKAASIGIGDSASVRQLGLIRQLKEEDRVVVDPSSPMISQLMCSGQCDSEQLRRLYKLALSCDWFLTGTNALTQDGVLMNVDACGNRVSGMFFGPKDVLIVVGTNKIVQDISAGHDRLRNMCAPQHTRTKQRKTPCAVTGECVNCNSPERLCNVTTIIEKKPTQANIHVLIVQTDLGLGWEKDWEPERIDGIRERYEEQTRTKRPAWLNS